MNWTYLAAVALVVGIILIWRTRRVAAPILDAEQMPEAGLWGYFFVLIGSWGLLSIFANPSDLFFVIMMAAAVLAGIAKLRGYQAKNGTKPMPLWAAFGFSNALVLALIGVGKTFVVEPMQIPSSSMRPGLIVGDFILINKFSYGIRIPFLNEAIIPVGKPQRGDVVVFRFPEDTKTNFIKRVIGLPGDKIEYRNKQLTINDNKVASIPVGEYKYRDENNERGGEQSPSSVIMEEAFNGKIHRTLNDTGKPTLEPLMVHDFPHRDGCQYDESGFVCTVPQGEYLMLGDNRDNSNDGRYWGFVQDNQLAGKAFVIWMNLHELGRIGTVIR